MSFLSKVKLVTENTGLTIKIVGILIAVIVACFFSASVWKKISRFIVERKQNTTIITKDGSVNVNRRNTSGTVESNKTLSKGKYNNKVREYTDLLTEFEKKYL